MKNRFLLFIFLLINLSTAAQNDVSITVNSEGSSLEEAKLNGFRNAIEQVFGTFVSSKTEILDDELVRDEIVSLGSGIITDYEILSQHTLPNSNTFLTMSATVSKNNLIDFSERKGVQLEFQGGLFSDNIRLLEMAKKSEAAVVRNLLHTVIPIINSSFDHNLSYGQPIKIKDNKDCNNCYEIPLTIEVTMNQNMHNVYSLVKTTLENISLKQNEREFLTQSKISFYELHLLSDAEPKNKKRRRRWTEDKYETSTIHLRNSLSYDWLLGLFHNYIPSQAFSGQLTNGIETISIQNLHDNYVDIREDPGSFYYRPPYKSNFYIDHLIKGNSISNVQNFTDIYGFDNVLRFILEELAPYNPYYSYERVFPHDKYFEMRSESVLKSISDNPSGNFSTMNTRNKLMLNLSKVNPQTTFTYTIKDRRSLDEISKITTYQITPTENSMY